MFNSLYGYGVLILIIIVMGVGFYLFYRSAESEKVKLVQENAGLQVTNTTQAQTINDLQKKAALVVKANGELTADLAKAEQQAADDKKKIDELNLMSEGNKVFTEKEQEDKANEVFHNSLRLFGHN